MLNTALETLSQGDNSSGPVLLGISQGIIVTGNQNPDMTLENKAFVNRHTDQNIIQLRGRHNGTSCWLYVRKEHCHCRILRKPLALHHTLNLIVGTEEKP